MLGMVVSLLWLVRLRHVLLSVELVIIRGLKEYFAVALLVLGTIILVIVSMSCPDST